MLPGENGEEVDGKGCCISEGFVIVVDQGAEGFRQIELFQAQLVVFSAQVSGHEPSVRELVIGPSHLEP